MGRCGGGKGVSVINWKFRQDARIFGRVGVRKLKALKQSLFAK